MRKLAVFVEGYTEVLFMDRLITEIVGANNVRIDQRKIRGGGQKSGVKHAISTISAANVDTGQKFYVLLFDCGGDKLVNTRVLQEHENLTRDGYNKIIGMRDVRPDFSYEDIPKLEIYLRKYIKTSLIPVEFILSVMEIEAWFLAEINHFPKIDPSITVDEVKKTLGFAPDIDDLSQRPNPGDDLNAAYIIGGKNYKKGEEATIKVLDYPYIYLELQNRIPYLKRLGDSLDAFFV